MDSLPGCWIVNAHDKLDKEFSSALKHSGYQRLKVKLLGRDPDEDYPAYRGGLPGRRGLRTKNPRLSVDSNEGHPSADAVLAYLQCLEQTDAEAYAALDYLEQPTNRDIVVHDFDWREVSSANLSCLMKASSAWISCPSPSGRDGPALALKTCKGHSFVLTVAAWAHRHGLLLTMQDLTNPGLAAIHSYQLAARLSAARRHRIELPSVHSRRPIRIGYRDCPNCSILLTGAIASRRPLRDWVPCYRENS